MARSWGTAWRSLELPRGDYNSSSNFRLFFCSKTKAFSFPSRVQRDICLETVQLWARGCLFEDTHHRLRESQSAHRTVVWDFRLFFFLALPPFFPTSLLLLLNHVPFLIRRRMWRLRFQGKGKFPVFFSVCLIKCAVDLWNCRDFWLQMSNSRGGCACLLMHFLCTARRC